jgi:hypothetical protein
MRSPGSNPGAFSYNDQITADCPALRFGAAAAAGFPRIDGTNAWTMRHAAFIYFITSRKAFTTKPPRRFDQSIARSKAR